MSPGLAQPVAEAPPAAAYRQRKQALLSRLQHVAFHPQRDGALRRLTALTDDVLRSLWQACGFDGAARCWPWAATAAPSCFPTPTSTCCCCCPKAATGPRRALRERIEPSSASAGTRAGDRLQRAHRGRMRCRAAADVTVQTALLEARRIAGSRTLFGQFEQRFAAELDALAFFVAKRWRCASATQVRGHALRAGAQLQGIARRPARPAHHRLAMRAPARPALGRLARAGLATALEVRQLRATRPCWRAPLRLHLVAGRREDRLVFDLQTAVAESFGYRSHRARRPPGPARQRAADAPLLLGRQGGDAAQPDPAAEHRGAPARRARRARALRPLNARFLERAGLLEVADDALYSASRTPSWRPFCSRARAGRQGPVGAHAARALQRARHDGPRFRATRSTASFMAILQQPQGITHAFRLMNQTSVLGRYLWPFRRIVGQMQHDLFHVYTVDQHILMVLRNVRRFFIPSMRTNTRSARSWPPAGTSPGCCTWRRCSTTSPRAAAATTRSWAREVRRFARQHGMARADRELVEFLVREHLTMSQVAQKQDLSDPDVMAAFARRVGNERA
jgi:[protein-PII] uridylyltransferase